MLEPKLVVQVLNFIKLCFRSKDLLLFTVWQKLVLTEIPVLFRFAEFSLRISLYKSVLSSTVF